MSGTLICVIGMMIMLYFDTIQTEKELSEKYKGYSELAKVDNDSPPCTELELDTKSGKLSDLESNPPSPNYDSNSST